MSHLFRYINLYSGNAETPEETKRRTCIIRAESESVCMQYMKAMRSYRNEQCMQLNIAMTEYLAEPNLEPAILLKETAHFRTLRFPFDFAAYQEIPAEQKSAFWLRVIHQAIMFAGTAWNWNLAFFDSVKKQIVT